MVNIFLDNARISDVCNQIKGNSIPFLLMRSQNEDEPSSVASST
eukprot:CAMPEP_0206415412 /NCGR_PEP_ID=MMETSP0294-20121207/36078_1 /ASSEMBLY_ACC=CAM_ASM_000327 /TAXON_ID=39354 /ORGANISM="Heterosigma akashiwo, Strain CCMP2393" /LENGTH=43 /DNA_ID= /DNA_START= /DNA_END= /DNA_ORIENTATION=